MPTEIEQYLESLGLEGDDRTAVLGVLSKNDKVKNNAITAHRERLSHADYTRKTMELSRERERIAAETAELNRQLSKTLTDLETGRTTQAQYEARLARIQDEYGIDQSDILTKKAPVQQEPAKLTVDPTILARLEAAEKNYGVSPRIAARISDLEREYRSVFGNSDGFSAEKLIDYADAHKLPLRADRDPDTGEMIGGPGAFERLYKVPQKKQELLISEVQKKAEADAEAKFQQRMDAALAGNATGERNPNSWNQAGSHLLSDRFKGNIATKIAERAKESGREVPPSQSRTAAQGELEGGAARFAKAFLERRAKGIDYGKDVAA